MSQRAESPHAAKLREGLDLLIEGAESLDEQTRDAHYRLIAETMLGLAIILARDAHDQVSRQKARQN